MTDLRAIVMNKLSASTSQHPVTDSALRKLHDDPNELHALLDELYTEHTVNRCAGIKEGKPYIAYWLTGMLNKPATPYGYNLPPRSHIVPRNETPRQEKAPPQENTMSKTHATGLGQIMGEIINSWDGISLADLHLKVEAVIPGTTLKQVVDMSYWMHGKHKIERRGRGKDVILHPCGVVAQSNIPQKKTKLTVAAEPWPVPPQQTKPPAAQPQPHCPKHDTGGGPSDYAALDCAAHLNGSITLNKGEKCIELDKTEATKLLSFLNYLCAYTETAAE